MKKINVLIFHELPFNVESNFDESFNIFHDGDNFKREEIDALIPLLSDRVDKNLIDSFPNLKIIANVGVGYNNIDYEYAYSKGIIVTNTPGVLTESTADLTFALILAVSRRILEADRFLRDGKFKGWDLTLFLGKELNQSILGIIGMGRIGQAVAKRAKGFGMKILYHNRNRVSEDIERELSAKYVSFEELISRSDIISLHCPLTQETFHLIDKEEFQMMKDGVIIINTARGPVINEKELVNFLKSGKVMGSGLDVFEREPEVEEELLHMKNVVLLPHIGSATYYTRTKIVSLAVNNVIEYFKRGKPLTPIK